MLKPVIGDVDGSLLLPLPSINRLSNQSCNIVNFTVLDFLQGFFFSVFFQVTVTQFLTLILPTPKVMRLCHQYRARPACTSLQADQALYCWLTSGFHLDISKYNNGQCMVKVNEVQSHIIQLYSKGKHFQFQQGKKVNNGNTMYTKILFK